MNGSTLMMMKAQVEEGNYGDEAKSLSQTRIMEEILTLGCDLMIVNKPILFHLFV